MRNSFLTKNGNCWIFQRRLPKSLDPDFRLAAVRVRLGEVTLKEARRLAILLGAAAQLAFERSAKEATVEKFRSTAVSFQKELRGLLPVLAGLDAAADCNATNPAMAKIMVETGLDALIALGADQVAGSALAKTEGRALQAHYRRVISDEHHARAYLGLEPVPPAASVLENVAAQVDRITSQFDALALQLRPKETPKFSVAADSYIAKLRKAKKANDEDKEPPEVAYLLHRRNLFIAIVGDKCVSEVTTQDLQDFVDEIQYLPKDYCRPEDYDATKVKDYIAENKALNKKDRKLTLSEATISGLHPVPKTPS